MIYVIIILAVISTWAITLLKHKSCMLIAQNQDMRFLRALNDRMACELRGHREGLSYRLGVEAGRAGKTAPLSAPIVNLATGEVVPLWKGRVLQ